MRPANKKKVSHRKGERGNILAYTVMSAFFLFLAVGLGVDLSHLYLAKTELQNTADAAALAGASALKLAVSNRIDISVDRVAQVMNANKYNFNNKTYGVTSTSVKASFVEFAKNLNDPNYKKPGAMNANDKSKARFIRVTTPSVSINTFFAIPILGLSRTLSATATAGLSVPGNISACPMPLTAVACAPGTNCNLCDPADGPNCTFSKYWGNCGGADPYALQPVDPAGGPGDSDGDGFCDPKKEFCKGCTYNIRAGPQNGQGPAPGAFLPLGCAGNGADDIRNALAGGQECPCKLGTGDGVEVPNQTGDIAGAVRQGLNVRFDQYGAGGLQYSSSIPPDTNIAQGDPVGPGGNQMWPGISWGQYQGTALPAVTPIAPSHPGVENRRVMVVPLTDMSSITDSNGHQTVTLTGLAGFFMRAQVSGGNGGDIQVEYIGDDIIGVIGFDPSETTFTNIVTPVLYR